MIERRTIQKMLEGWTGHGEVTGVADFVTEHYQLTEGHMTLTTFEA